MKATIDELKWMTSEHFPKDSQKIAEFRTIIETAIRANQDLLKVVEYMEDVQNKKNIMSN